MPRLSKEQRAARREGIGSSDVAELLGISPYEGASPVRLFAEKIGLVPDEDEEEETVEQRVGHALEGALVLLYEQESGFKVETVGALVETVRHPEHAWRIANLDARIVAKRASLEIKVVGIGMAADWDLEADDGIPHYVRVQCAWQMHCAELDEVHVVALIGGTQFRVFYIRRDLELEELIVSEAAAFWELVKARKAPPLDATSSCKAYLDRLYPPKAEDVELELDAEKDAELIAVGVRRIRAARAEKRANEAKELANNELREAFGSRGATRLWCHLWRASYRANKNGARSLLIDGRGELEEEKIRKPRATSKRPPVLVDDGEAF